MGNATVVNAEPPASKRQGGRFEVCTGGNRNGLSIGQWLKKTRPQVYSALPKTEQARLRDLYEGTVCKSTKSISVPVQELAGANLPAESVARVQASTAAADEGVTSGAVRSTPPIGTECTPTGNPGWFGCVKAEAVLETVHNFGSWDYRARVQMEADIHLSGYVVTWGQPASTNFRDNKGNSWGMGVSNYTFNYGTHIAYGTLAEGTGRYNYYDPIVLIQLVNMLFSQVHMGYSSTYTGHFAGVSSVPQPFCFYGDFNSQDSSPIGGGWCANP